MFFHERDAGVDVLNHFSKIIVINQSTGTGSVETPGSRVQVCVVVQVRSNFVCQHLEPSLLCQEVLAFGSE